MIMPMLEDTTTRLVADRRRLLGRLERAARRTRKRGQPEAIHDVRVITRQLEASLDLWRSILPRRRRRRARRALGALRRDLGPAREVRISLTLLHERFTALPPDARLAAALLQDFMRQRLERLDARAARRCARREIGRVRRRFEQVWEGDVLDGQPGMSLLEAGRARLAKRRNRGHMALREAAQSGANERLHSARVAAKRWRYMLERLAVTDPTADVSEQTWLKEVQEALGQIQDLAVLRQGAMRLGPRLALAECEVSSEAVQSLLESLEAERTECFRTFCRLAATGAPDRALPLEAVPAALRWRGA